ncbi:peptidase M14 [Aequorivita sp. H23M31]|uniref:Peptidase M14 n=1 Tax=Aequorivita ciconiae TaxID=2494375 RepID=A0A410FZY7_9FLAO|nr:M14 family zinc carboxypeptidase [Aequorivita sp. H23M31]QAA80577.1 peptidase M14 [Aequorivita sp. H23M31]
MKIEDWYRENFESDLLGKYITLQMISPLLDCYTSLFEISVVGISEKGRNIPMIQLGNGPRKFLAWSQMHGNESTTTRAIFDLIKFFGQTKHFQSEINEFLNSYSFYIIPILNPDGSVLYTRENANGVDLNRDAQNLSQRESVCLRSVFDKLEPEGCFNMHDQRSIYGFDNGKPAIISFLSPSSDQERSITSARRTAMEGIVRMNRYLEKKIPGNVGRYDDSFNADCVGDTFQMAGVPTILFEAGHFKGDYMREKSRELIFYSVLSFFGLVGEKSEINFEEYFQIPENRKNYRDIIFRNVKVLQSPNLLDIAIQYHEVLSEGLITFDPYVEEVGNLKNIYGHIDEDLKGREILTKPAENLTDNVKVFEFVKNPGWIDDLLA